MKKIRFTCGSHHWKGFEYCEVTRRGWTEIDGIITPDVGRWVWHITLGTEGIWVVFCIFPRVSISWLQFSAFTEYISHMYLYISKQDFALCLNWFLIFHYVGTNLSFQNIICCKIQQNQLYSSPLLSEGNMFQVSPMDTWNCR